MQFQVFVNSIIFLTALIIWIKYKYGLMSRIFFVALMKLKSSQITLSICIKHLLPLMTRTTKKLLAYNSKKYQIVVKEYTDGTAFAEVRGKKLYKHGIYRWNKTHHKKNSEIFSKWIQPAHCLIDNVGDYIDYHDCLLKLRHSRSARRWFIQTMKPIIDKYF